jgi:hypothetical protein
MLSSRSAERRKGDVTLSVSSSDCGDAGNPCHYFKASARAASRRPLFAAKNAA